MARALYRIYLYVVCLALLGFVAITMVMMLTNLLLLTSLRGAYEQAPDSRALSQSVVLAVVALVVSGLLGGLHYWLLRRDIAQEGQAALGMVRAIMLNLALVAAALIALFMGASTLERIGQPTYGGISGSLAAALVAVGVFALVEWERRRGLPRTGHPVTVQRLHYYGLLTVTLIPVFIYGQDAIRTTLVAILGATGALPRACDFLYGGPEGCSLTSPLAGRWLAVAWALMFGAYYLIVSRGDTNSILRQVAQFIGYVVGIGVTLTGVYSLARLLLQAALGVSAISAESLVTYGNFLAPLVVGGAVVAGYTLWLLREGPRSRLGQPTTELTALSLGAISVGVPFYIGVYTLLVIGVEALFGSAEGDVAVALANGLALVIAGIAHPFLAWMLRVRSKEDARAGPRRGLVFAGLAAGALTAAIGTAFALYLVITAAIGTATAADWGFQARQAGSAAVVGLFLVGIHGWQLYRERGLMPRPAPSPVTEPAEARRSIEATVDNLLAGRITRDQAVSQLHSLTDATR